MLALADAIASISPRLTSLKHILLYQYSRIYCLDMFGPVQRLINLYAAWYVSDPGTGYDAMAVGGWPRRPRSQYSQSR